MIIHVHVFLPDGLLIIFNEDTMLVITGAVVMIVKVKQKLMMRCENLL